MKRLIKFILYIGIIVGSVYLYGHFIESKTIIVKEYSIIDEKLPNSFHGLKIVHFSDLLFDNEIITIKEITNLVNKINKLKPDIVIFTGNLFNTNYKVNDAIKDTLSKELSKIDSAINNYASITSFDKDYLDTLSNSNFVILDNENKTIYNNDNVPIKLIGYTSDLEKSFSNINDDDYVIMLSNNPDIIDEVKNVNLLFSGKSLGGEIRIPYYGGLIKHTKYLENTQVKEIPLYINNGIGINNKYKIRLFNYPSISFYRLYNS